MGRFSFTYIAGKTRSYDDLKKRFQNRGAAEKENAVVATPQFSVQIPSPINHTSTSEHPESRQSSMTYMGCGAPVLSTSLSDTEGTQNIHKASRSSCSEKRQVNEHGIALGGKGAKEEILFGPETNLDPHSIETIVITDAEPDYLSSPELTDSSSSSTNSELSTITILVTPVLDCPSEDKSFGCTLSPSTPYSTTSKAVSGTARSKLDTKLLMPPCPENLLDSRRQRKAKEHREIKKWLITFLNNKGPQFPSKLGQRVMEIYRIDSSELAPSIVAQFRRDSKLEEDLPADLSAALYMIQDENRDKQLLQILRAFFHSQIREMTPPRPENHTRHSLLGPTISPRMHGPYPEIPRSYSKTRLQSYADPISPRAFDVPSKNFTKHLSYTIRDPTPRNHNHLEVPTKITTETKRQETERPPVEVSKSAAQTRASRGGIFKGTFAAIREALGGKGDQKKT
ncbi:hypothetical protein PVAG01_06714 [Phlyctema vagabunda]|uniref:Uncharacterized protein n=1 Tax=Phlyctema vagabunda TaxID=108571 RepID=A0ABR4PHI5_9HELO